MAALKSRDVEIALAGRPPADLAVEKVADRPAPLCADRAARPPVGRRRPRKPHALAGEAFLFREPGSGTRSLFDYFLGDLQFRRPMPDMELGSNETIKQAVMAGLGVALISAHTVAAEIAERRLVDAGHRGPADRPAMVHAQCGASAADAGRRGVPGFRAEARGASSCPEYSGAVMKP